MCWVLGIKLGSKETQNSVFLRERHTVKPSDEDTVQGELYRGRTGGWEGPGEGPLTDRGRWESGEGFPRERTISWF